MAQSRFLQSSFASGELSPFLKGRTDLEQYYLGCETAENVTVVPQGGLKKRQGSTEYSWNIHKQSRSSNPVGLPNGGTFSHVTDNNRATISATTTGVGTTDPYVIATYDFGATTRIVNFDITDISRTSLLATPPTFSYPLTGKIQAGNFGVDWADVAQFNITDDPSDVRNRLGTTRLGVSYRYWRVIATDASVNNADSNTTVTLSGINIYIPNTSSFAPVKQVPFAVTAIDNYMVLVSAYRTEVYRASYEGSYDIPQFLTSFANDFTNEAVEDIRYTSYQNVLLLFHKDHAPKRLIINDYIESAPTDIIYEDIPFIAVPQYDYNDSSSPNRDKETIMDMTLVGHSSNGIKKGEQFQIEISGIVSKSITWAGDATQDETDATVENIRKNLQEMPLWGSSGITVSHLLSNTHNYTYRIKIDSSAGGNFELFSGYFVTGNAGDHTIEFIDSTAVGNGGARAEDLWSSTRGYPKMGAFHNGRLWLGGFKKVPQGLAASKPSQYFDFKSDSGADDEGIFIVLQGRKATAIHDMNSHRNNLQVFTSGVEFIVSGNTSATVSASEQTQHGVIDCDVASLDGTTLFLESSGHALRQYNYNYNEDGFFANNLSTLSSHLLDSPTEIVGLAGTVTEESNFVFVNNGSSLAVLNTLRAQDINGWTRFTAPTGYTFDSIAGLASRLYIIFKRTSDGERIFTVYGEIQQTSGQYLDMPSEMLETRESVTVNSAGNVYINDNISNNLCDIYIDGVYKSTKTASSGSIYIGSDEISSFPATVDISVGINITAKVKSMPLNTNAGSGGNALSEKRINRINLRVHDSNKIKIDGVEAKILDDSTGILHTGETNVSGVITDNSGGKGWGIYVNPEISSDAGYGFHVQSIEYEVESS